MTKSLSENINNEEESRNEKKLETIKEVIQEEAIDTRLILDSIPIGVCITDQRGMILNINVAFTKLFEYTKELLIGTPFIDLIAESSRKNFSTLPSNWNGQHYIQQGKWRMVNRKGKTFSVLANSSFQMDETTMQLQQIIFLVDIQDYEKTHMELQSTINVLYQRLDTQEESQQEAVHDLKNNVGSIVNIADILLHRKPTPEQERWLQMIMQVGTKTLSILQVSSDYDRMNKQEYTPEINAFDLADIVRKVVDVLSPATSQRAIHLALIYEGQPIDIQDMAVPMKADAFYIEQLLHNLLQNAVEASPNKGVVTLGVEKHDGLRLKLHNQGVIPLEVRPQFFEKYTTAGKENSSGLGTYLAKLIVELHEGTIAYHTSEAEGTTIHINLPQRLLND
ncbi:MAG: PAS domain-containing sensor histidine kinase [Cyclobacteriaceae bacterium]